ncbi:hypothetical protein [Paenibacillus contaminans]|uniref:Uncharacterized protein n=1 Tax=Paenibacillus contaminans TaxID=450362 RepID=A0A329MIF5_9BACL|nr:hypothetical protein [Paenibacillus contaminans]RAV19500.1 hypothetical protein DQG23_21165 [Paenibacillus contaminans]
MTKKIENARKYLQQAHEIKGTSMGFLRERVFSMREELSKIRGDKNLSAQGKSVKTAQAKAKRGVEFLQQTHTRRQEYVLNLKKAVREAEGVIYETVQKPDETKLERFESEMRTLKTELLLSMRKDTALRKFSEFISRIDDAYLASIVREQYADFAGPIISLAGTDVSVKGELARTFEQLKTGFESPEVAEARMILESANAFLESPRLFAPGLADEAVDEVFSYSERDLEIEGRTPGSRNVTIRQYINDTDTYFQAYPDKKPADYVGQ